MRHRWAQVDTDLPFDKLRASGVKVRRATALRESVGVTGERWKEETAGAAPATPPQGYLSRPARPRRLPVSARPGPTAPLRQRV